MRIVAIALAAVFTLSAADTDRTADRAAIRADIEGIYRAFIEKDRAKVRATHDENWRGFLEGSRQMIRGIEQYMDWVGSLSSPYGMSGFKIRDFDIVFQGDAAFVTFITDIDVKTPSGPITSVQRLADFYVKKDGKWMQAGSNTSISPEAIAEQNARLRPLGEGERTSLLAAREAVWRAIFANDRATVDQLIPAELITIDPEGSVFSGRQQMYDFMAWFAGDGGKLASLEFPKTEIQAYGATVIVYSTYRYETEKNGVRTPHSGRVTEIFVLRNGRWLNPGWHMDSMKL